MFDSHSSETATRRSFMKGIGTLGLAASGVGASAGSAAAQEQYSYTIMDGTKYETKVFVNDSGNSGPTTLVTGGIHGDEEPGFLAADRIKDWNVQNGKLVVIPRCNEPAIQDRTRDNDNGDLNRQFPPRSGECHTQLASEIWSVAVEHDPDIAFDLHSARGVYHEGPRDSVGQALFPTWTDPARSRGENTVSDINDEYNLGWHPDYKMGNDIDADRYMLMHRIAGRLDIPGWICETAENVGESRDERVQWHLYTVEHLMNQFGQYRGSTKSASSSDTGEKELLVEGTGPVTQFEAIVSGSIRGKEGTLEGTDAVGEDIVSGQVSTLDDTYLFTGDLEQFAVTSGSSSDVNVYVDGEEIEVSESHDVRELRVLGEGPEVEWKFDVSGEIVDARDLESEDTVGTTSVSGQVSTADDYFDFTGNVESFLVTDGSAEDITVTVDGTEIQVTEQEDEHELIVEGHGPEVQWEFSTTGEITDAHDLEDTDEVNESSVAGQVSTADDYYDYTGSLEEFIVTNGSKEDISVYVDGREIEISESTTEKELIVEGHGPETQWKFGVTGEITEATDLESEDEVGHSFVSGQVSIGDDRYVYTGELEQFTVTGGDAEDLTVTVDGDEVSVTEKTEEHELIVEGLGPEVQWEFEVSDEIVDATDLEREDDVGHDSVTGQVSVGDDRYVYTGELEQFTVTNGSPDDVTVTVDGDEIPISARTQTITIEGTGPVVEWELSVSGVFTDHGKLESTDDFRTSAVVGQVSTQDDWFEFTGDINNFDVESGSPDDINVYLNGSHVSPESL